MKFSTSQLKCLITAHKNTTLMRYLLFVFALFGQSNSSVAIFPLNSRHGEKNKRRKTKQRKGKQKTALKKRKTNKNEITRKRKKKKENRAKTGINQLSRAVRVPSAPKRRLGATESWAGDKASLTAVAADGQQQRPSSRSQTVAQGLCNENLSVFVYGRGRRLAQYHVSRRLAQNKTRFFIRQSKSKINQNVPEKKEEKQQHRIRTVS